MYTLYDGTNLTNGGGFTYNFKLTNGNTEIILYHNGHPPRTKSPIVLNCTPVRLKRVRYK